MISRSQKILEKDLLLILILVLEKDWSLHADYYLKIDISRIMESFLGTREAYNRQVSSPCRNIVQASLEDWFC